MESLSIQNYKTDNITPKREPNSQSINHSSRINPDDFNQHVNKRFAQSFGTYSLDPKLKQKGGPKTATQNNGEPDDNSNNNPHRLSYNRARNS